MSLATLLVLVAIGAPKSGPIQISDDGRWVWAANPDHGSVARIDTTDGELLEIPLEPNDSPRGVAIGDSEVWIACHGSDRVYVLDLDGKRVAQLDLPFGSGPYSVVLSPDRSRALVTLHRTTALALIDARAKRIDRLIPVFMSSLGIVWLPDDSVWITHLFTDEEHPRLTRLDLSGAEPHVTTRIIASGSDPRISSRLDSPYDIAEGGYLFFRGHLAQVPNQDRVWVPTEYHNITEDQFTPDSTNQATIRELDLKTRQLPNTNDDKIILTAVHVHDPAHDNPYVGPGWNARFAGPVDIAFSNDGRIAYVVGEQSNDVIVVPTDTPAFRPEGAPPLVQIAVGDGPIGIASSPNASTAYVLNQLSRDLSVIDLESKREIARWKTTKLPEPYPPAILEGAKLFESSADPRMSENRKVACASCHPHGEHETRVWQFQHLPGRHGPRQSVSLLGIGRTYRKQEGLGLIHRSGDRDELQDFEHTITGPLMGGRGFLGKRVRRELGPEPNAGLDPSLDALAAYVLSLPPLMRSPHRKQDGSLSDAAVRGARLFFASGCAECHVPETGFVDFAFHDVGSRRPKAERELSDREPRWAVKTPALVGLWSTPPYVGGSKFCGTILELLRDQAVRAGGEHPHGAPVGLTERQLSDLAELLLSIDGRTTAEELRTAADRTPPEVVRAELISPSRIAVWFDETIDRASMSFSIDGDPVERTEYFDRSGDRVDLIAELEAGTHRLRTERVRDLAGNAMEPCERELVLGDTITVTLGASAQHDIPIRVDDASMVSPELPDWAHDKVWLTRTKEDRSTTGFVRFDFAKAFAAATGARTSEAIEAASFSLLPDDGDAASYEARRCLLAWRDPADDGGDFLNEPPTNGHFYSNPIGAPTWNSAAHRGQRWNGAGATKLGADVAAEIDAVASIASLTDRATFAGPQVTKAFRAWFDHPEKNFGHALRLADGRSTKFHAWEEGFGDRGPVLTITYRPERPIAWAKWLGVLASVSTLAWIGASLRRWRHVQRSPARPASR